MRIGLALGLLLVAACGGEGDNTGGVTAEESRKLDEAAEMLDAAPNVVVAEVAVTEEPATNEQ